MENYDEMIESMHSTVNAHHQDERVKIIAFAIHSTSTGSFERVSNAIVAYLQNKNSANSMAVAKVLTPYMITAYACTHAETYKYLMPSGYLNEYRELMPAIKSTWDNLYELQRRHN